MKIRLTITADYKLNKTDPEALEEILGNCARHLYENGMLSGTTNAEVKDADCRIDLIGRNGKVIE